MRKTYFHILLALHEGPRHGLGIADEIQSNTAGGLKLGPGTLYRTLKEMDQKRLIELVPPPVKADPRRKHYAITQAGRERLKTEATRFAEIVQIARQRRILPESS